MTPYLQGVSGSATAVKLNYYELMDLPIFEFHDGEVKKLDSMGAASVMPPTSAAAIPEFDFENCIDAALKYIPMFEELYKRMGFKFLTFESAYTDVILPQFKNLTENHQKLHLGALERFLGVSPDAGSLQYALSKMPLVTAEGSFELKPVSQLYDGDVELFRIFKRESILSTSYMHRDLETGFLGLRKHFFEKLGLKLTVGRDEVLEFCKSVEDMEGLGIEQQQEEVDCLLAYAFDNRNVGSEEPATEVSRFLQSLGKIRILPTVKPELEKLMGLSRGRHRSGNGVFSYLILRQNGFSPPRA